MSEDTVTISNAKYYSQEDEPWCSELYSVDGSSGRTMGTSGCGPTCMAIVVSTILGENINPHILKEDSVAGGLEQRIVEQIKDFMNIVQRNMEYHVNLQTT